jgi:hypothetical protein
VLAAGAWWLHEVIAAHGLQTESLTLAWPLLVCGLGIGQLVSPLFDFILASVTDDEVGSASGVLNAVQQLGGALGVAAMGTLFFTTLSHSGFVPALSHCLIAELASTPVLLALVSTLPARAREGEAEAVVVSGATPALEPAAEVAGGRRSRPRRRPPLLAQPLPDEAAKMFDEPVVLVGRVGRPDGGHE